MMFRTAPTTFGRRLLAPCVLLLALALPAGASGASSADVKRAINKLSGASGAYVWNITDGRAVAGANQGGPRILASNTKLFTAAATLLRHGTGGRFSTAVFTDGPVANGVVSGDLYLRGGGDPLFGNAAFVTANFGSRATLQALARGIADRGITRIDGAVLGDQSAFDPLRGTSYSAWRRSGDIGGVLGGLIVDKGFVNGRYQANPPVFAAQQLASALRTAGVRVGTRSGARATPAGATRLAVVRSLPASALVRQMNKPSNNYLAEMLVKSLALPAGAADDDADGGFVEPGSRSATTLGGDARSRAYAATLGSSVQLADGSGLSRSDRAAPREVVDLLRGMQRTVAFADFRASLPIAGVDGTLAGRMRGTAAQRACTAKTGTLSNVSTLSGYCTTAGGDLVAFSILQNRVAPWRAHIQQDRVAATIAALD
jgi:D-alanyl-D-alanine carboxypeptidase/D-alanyl-D-alanine-endopeptidase (penicillin-binding protein 4)